MKRGGPATLGDFGAGGRQSDTLIDREAAATAAATGQWAYHVHTSTTIAWEIPGTAATLLLKRDDEVWRLQRAGRPLGTRSTLDAGIAFAEQYMRQRPAGGR
ncbi:hypothetical protein EGH21_21430 [Halomicroarcula sp. F13]|uniref:Uncharacterized protein n=1 Tax=Haloarcula rubra TaxID=2487747 RepID=A0AAW4PYM1_9EURY|nr:hypothetical protein [Halomicroarcula rubra]MBX0325590.1 hypothetical protein [Halomicroarcula rubra]